MKVKEKTINLLPKAYIQAEKVKRKLMMASGILILEVIGFIYFVVVPTKNEILETKQQLELLTESIHNDAFVEESLMLQQLEVAEADVNAWKTLYNQLKRENFVSSYVLESLVSRVPLDVTINKLTVMPEVEEDESLVRMIGIEGNARDTLSVLNYTTTIEENFGLGTVSYEVTYDEEYRGCHYTIHVTIPLETAEGGTNE